MLQAGNLDRHSMERQEKYEIIRLGQIVSGK
jgi:hypothetical protein